MNQQELLIKPSEWERTTRMNELTRIAQKRLGEEETLTALLGAHKGLVIAVFSAVILYGLAGYYLDRKEEESLARLQQERPIHLNGNAIRQYTER